MAKEYYENHVEEKDKEVVKLIRSEIIFPKAAGKSFREALEPLVKFYSGKITRVQTMPESNCRWEIEWSNQTDYEFFANKIKSIGGVSSG